MKSTDKFLIAIVAGVVLLIVVAFTLVLSRPKPAYQTGDTAEAVAHNYLLALDQKDYERAYRYVSAGLPGYPVSADQFKRELDRYNYYYGGHGASISLEVLSTTVTGDRAAALVRETTFYRRGLFDSGNNSQTFEMSLKREQAGWKIVSSGRYWAWCWEDSAGCQ